MSVESEERPAETKTAPDRRKVKRWQEWVAVWLARIVTISVVLSAAAFIDPQNTWLSMAQFALAFLNIPSGPSLFMVLLTWVIADALRRRLRPAHTVLVVLMCVGMAASLVGLLWTSFAIDNAALTDIEVGGATLSDLFTWQTLVIPVMLVVNTAVLVVVVRARAAFPGRSDPRSLRPALAVLACGISASFLITLMLTFALGGTGLRGSLLKLKWTLFATIGIPLNSDPLLGAQFTNRQEWIFHLAGTLSALALALALRMYWRSVRERETLTPQDELTLRSLIAEHGEKDSLSYFATRRDKSIVFSPDERAAVTFRNVGTVCVASADPIGAHNAWRSAIDSWLKRCRDRGQFAAVVSASKAGAAAYAEAGMKVLSLGDEAVVETEAFTLVGPTMRPVRQAVTRLTKAGYTVQVRRQSSIAPDEMATLMGLAKKWRGEDDERGFSMALGRLGDLTDRRVIVVTAHDDQAQPQGLLSFVPWGARGLSLDVMLRSRTADNGVNELMVASLLEQGPGLGIRRVSLNFAMFRNVFFGAEQIGAGPVMKLSDRLLGFLSRFWQLETLYQANAKYQPVWTPRFMCYDPRLSLTRAALAQGQVEGFAPLLSLGDILGRRRIEQTRPEPEFVAQVQEIEEQALVARKPLHPLTEQQRVRRAKLNRLRAEGMDGYPVEVPKDTTIAEIRAEHPQLAPDECLEETVSIAGRVRSLRKHKNVTFAIIEEQRSTIQVILDHQKTPQQSRWLWRRGVDLGDLVSITGTICASRTGELSVLLQSWTMASKCLSPLPGKRDGFNDPEARLRNRSLDFIVNPDSLDMLYRRSAGVRSLRNALEARGYTEVETPMLQAIHGGATARPFQTHINAYNTDLYLRIAPELYLKRLCIGGMNKVFELNRNFRNEGADATHNPEFTMVEAYSAYGDYNSMRELIRDIILEVAVAVNGKPVAIRTDEHGKQIEVDISQPWPVVTVHEAVGRAVGSTLTSATPRSELVAICRERGVHVDDSWSAGELLLELYDQFVEGQTFLPTFYSDFPLETSPLTRVHRTDPALSERWDLVAFGAEIGTAYSELVDPIDQRERFTEQSMKAAAGDLEAMQIDESFLSAMEYAMAPSGGMGMGVDRLIMMLTGTNIRSTLAFPFVRPNTD